MALALRRPYRRAGASAREPVPADQAATRPSRGRIAAARGASAVGSLMLALARLVRLVAGIVALVIVVAIVLRVASANGSNAIVRDIHDAGRALVGPFKNVFSIKNPKAAIAVNWGLAALVYLIVGGFIAGLIARMAPRGMRSAQPVA